MAAVGLSLVFASVVYLMVRPPPWLSSYLDSWRQSRIEQPDLKPAQATRDEGGDQASTPKSSTTSEGPTIASAKADADRPSISPPSPPVPPAPTVSTTSDPDPGELATAHEAGPSETPSSPSIMPPPPRPTPSSRPPTLSPLLQSRRRPQQPPSTRGPGTFILSLPQTHTSKPQKSTSRTVSLQPGRSPLDWARISSSSTADLRNLPPGTPYLKITPSQLKIMNGRPRRGPQGEKEKGNDAWMALNGKVYNVEPYREFHPGGVGELMRGAGKDGTRLFGEVHPWVNYEAMLRACLVGILVEEHESAGTSCDMDEKTDWLPGRFLLLRQVLGEDKSRPCC